jgi:hypothetical protein
MALAVIGSGFGRTGTLSLKGALDELDLGPCHHMTEVFQHPEQVAHWQAAAAGRAVYWDDVFAGFRSQVDWPGAHWWRELAAAYPQAKVIHTVRPEERWWTSFAATIAVVIGGGQDIPAPPHVRAMMAVAAEIIGPQTIGPSLADRTAALAAYRRRTVEVRAAIPPERLLVFDVAEGWEPLCRFLDRPVPAAPFPHVNSTEEWWQKLKARAP